MSGRKFMSVGRTGVFVAFGAAVAVIAGESALPPVPSPVENAPSPSKTLLGKILFFEEQLSADNTTACATCHVMALGGTDPRRGVNPGGDLAFGNANDVFGSPGMRPLAADGAYGRGSVFGLRRQVTFRVTPSNFLSGYADSVNWDGSAGRTFVDPVTQSVVVQKGGALESQALLPLLDATQMGHIGRTFPQILAKLASVTPLALADRLPEDVAAALEGDPNYPELFRRAFGDAEITAARIALAIASWERTLAPDQTDYDRFVAGDETALTEAERRGLDAFNTVGCAECHPAPMFTDNSFRATGVRPPREDGGLGDLSLISEDDGKFKVPSLRNVALKRSFFHDGRRSTLREAVAFYRRAQASPDPAPAPEVVFIRGSVFDDPVVPYRGSEPIDSGVEAVQFVENQDPVMANIRLSAEQAADIEAFLRGGLVDARVQNETAPFDRPRLASENADLQAQISGVGRGGIVVPEIVVATPALEGTNEFRIGIAGAPADTSARLMYWQEDPGNRTILPIVFLEPSLSAGGTATVFPDISAAAAGDVIHFQWQVDDQRAPGNVSISRIADVRVFAKRSVDAPVAGQKRARVAPPAVDDRNAFVARASFRLDWAAHRRDADQDEFTIAARINPRGIGADLSHGRIHVAIDGVTVLDGAALDAEGFVRSETVDALYDRDIGTVSLSLRGLDLREALADVAPGRSGRAAVPIAVRLDGLGLTDPTVATEVQFDWRSRGGVAVGRFDFARSGTGRGTFQITRIATVATAGGLRVKAYGMLDAPGGARIDVSGGLVLQVGSASKFTLMPETIEVSRKGLVSAIGSNELRSLRIDPRTRTFSFDVVVADPVTNGVPFGTIVSLPVRLDTSPSTEGPDGEFETVAEIRIR